MTITSSHTQACFNAWMNCEDLLVNLGLLKTSVSRKVTKVVDECAVICMGTFHALKTSSINISRFALLCIGICEECAEVCETIENEQFRQCARTCRQCSRSISALAASEFE